ncbi:MAG: low affinity iron permease family protein [Candidatus Saccharimonadales bacterium]
METKLKRLKVLVVRHHGNNGTQQPVRSDTFHKISVKISNKLGSAFAFYIAVLAILVWIVSGPVFGFSNTWQLVINTGTTIVTFLMVFVIQNTQNRDGRAMQLKLDELIKASRNARSEFVDIEDLTDAELDELQGQFRKIHENIELKKK